MDIRLVLCSVSSYGFRSDSINRTAFRPSYFAKGSPGKPQQNGDNDDDNNTRKRSEVVQGAEAVIGPRNPLYLHANENPSLVLVHPPLDGGNYHSWSRAMRMALKLKNKLGFATGTVGVLNEGDENYEAWEQANSTVLSWILNSVTIPIAQSAMWLNTAADVWNDLHIRFSHGDSYRLSDILEEINMIKQRDMSVTEYYTSLKILWEELLALRPLLVCKIQCNCGAGQLAKDYFDLECVIRFLKGLNDRFEPVRDRAYLTQHMPSINQVFGMAIKHERQVSYSVGHPNDTNASAFAATKVRGYSYRPSQDRQPYDQISDESNKNIKCYYCGVLGHIKAICYKKHGFPSNERGRGRGNGGRTYFNSRGPSATINQAEWGADDTKSVNQLEWSGNDAAKPVDNAGFTQVQIQQIMTMIQGACGNQVQSEHTVNQTTALNANFEAINHSGDKFSTDWDKAWSSFKRQGKKTLFSGFTPDKYVTWNPRRSEFPLAEEVDPIKRTERSNLRLWTSPGFTLGLAVVIVTFLLVYTILFPIK